MILKHLWNLAWWDGTGGNYTNAVDHMTALGVPDSLAALTSAESHMPLLYCYNTAQEPAHMDT